MSVSSDLPDESCAGGTGLKSRSVSDGSCSLCGDPRTECEAAREERDGEKTETHSLKSRRPPRITRLRAGQDVVPGASKTVRKAVIYMNLGRNTDRDGQQRRHRLGADRSGVHYVGQDRT